MGYEKIVSVPADCQVLISGQDLKMVANLKLNCKFLAEQVVVRLSPRFDAGVNVREFLKDPRWLEWR